MSGTRTDLYVRGVAGGGRAQEQQRRVHVSAVRFGHALRRRRKLHGGRRERRERTVRRAHRDPAMGSDVRFVQQTAAVSFCRTP